ncbi:unnamed protein product [Amoebophrya sp. A120]|nr:unnamed protein product [Amoebophrya sp. A120]|eukprot:GSA120T00009231001.1
MESVMQHPVEEMAHAPVLAGSPNAVVEDDRRGQLFPLQPATDLVTPGTKTTTTTTNTETSTGMYTGSHARFLPNGSSSSSSSVNKSRAAPHSSASTSLSFLKKQRSSSSSTWGLDAVQDAPDRFWKEHAVLAALSTVFAAGLFHITPALLAIAYQERWHLDPRSCVVEQYVKDETNREGATTALENSAQHLPGSDQIVDTHAAPTSSVEHQQLSADAILDIDTPRLRRYRVILFRWWFVLVLVCGLQAVAVFVYSILVLWGSARTATKHPFLPVVKEPEATSGSVHEPVELKLVNHNEFSHRPASTGAGATPPISSSQPHEDTVRLHFGFFDAKFYKPEAQKVFGFNRKGGNLYYSEHGDHDHHHENFYCLTSHMHASMPTTGTTTSAAPAAPDSNIELKKCEKSDQNQLFAFDGSSKMFHRIEFGGVNGGVVVKGAGLALRELTDGNGTVVKQVLVADTSMNHQVRFPQAEVEEYADPAAIGFGLYLLFSSFFTFALTWRLLMQKKQLRLWFRQQGAGSPVRPQLTWKQRKEYERRKRNEAKKHGGVGIGFGFGGHKMIQGGFSKI